MACEHTYDGNTVDLLDFITAHHPDDTVAWTTESMDGGEVIVRSTAGSKFVVRPGQRVRWSKADWPEGRFEVRNGMVIR